MTEIAFKVVGPGVAASETHEAKLPVYGDMDYVAYRSRSYLVPVSYGKHGGKAFPIGVAWYWWMREGALWCAATVFDREGELAQVNSVGHWMDAVEFTELGGLRVAGRTNIGEVALAVDYPDPPQAFAVRPLKARRMTRRRSRRVRVKANAQRRRWARAARIGGSLLAHPEAAAVFRKLWAKWTARHVSRLAKDGVPEATAWAGA